MKAWYFNLGFFIVVVFVIFFVTDSLVWSEGKKDMDGVELLLLLLLYITKNKWNTKLFILFIFYICYI